MLNIISTLFATTTLLLQWIRSYAQLSQVPRTLRDRTHCSSILFLGTLSRNMDHTVATAKIFFYLSVILFLAALVIFFFTIHKIVCFVALIPVGLFKVVYLALRPCLFPYRTPLIGDRDGRRGDT